MQKLLGLSAFLVVAAVSGASASPFEDALSAYDKGNWSTASALLLPIAKADTTQSAEAQLRLGRLAEQGKGMPKDAAEAAKWYQKSADAGNIEAQAYLGRLYRTGAGVPRDPMKAAKYSIKAASQNNPIAEASLGYMAMDGMAGPVDPAAAVGWFKKGAVQGNSDAMLGLGMLFEAGKGVPKDLVQARQWYALASVDKGDGNAEQVDKARKAQDALTAKMSPAQIAQADKFVVDFKPVVKR